MSLGTEFPNFKLGEKKQIKENEAKFDASTGRLREKLGNDWSFQIDWAAIGKLTEDKQSARGDLTKNVFKNLIEDFLTNDLDKFDALYVEALNYVVVLGSAPAPAAKLVVITMGEKTLKYPWNSRLQVEFGAGQLILRWNADWFSYSHGENYVFKTLSQTANALPMPPIPGPWLLGEISDWLKNSSIATEQDHAIKAKLGAQWTLEIDFLSFASNAMNRSPTMDVGKVLVKEKLVALVQNDISKFDSLDVDAINKITGVAPAKRLVYALGAKTIKYATNSRITVEHSEGLLKITWNCDWLTYTHAENYVQKYVLSTMNACAMPPVPGDWTLSEIKSIISSQAAQDSALTAVRAKFGNDWNIQIDWEAFSKETKGQSARSDCSKMIVGNLVENFVKNDLSKMDGDVVEALNDKVSTSKTITFTMGPKSAKYAFNSRCNVTVDAKGIVLQWSQDWATYAWGESYLTNWTLKNC